MVASTQSISNSFLALLIAGLSCISAEGYCQKIPCSECVLETKRFLGGKIKKSKKPMVFRIQNLKGELKLNNLGHPLTVEMSFTFKDSLIAQEIGDLLVIGFEDGTHQEVIQSSRKTYAGTAYFILMQPTGNTAVMALEDRKFYEKLKRVDISSFRLTVSGTRRDIIVPGEKSKLLKRTIECLVE